MTDVPQITDLHSVLEPHLNGGKLISYTSRYLTKPGENYGSVMLALNTIIENPKGERGELPLIAKLPPVTNQFFWNIFNPEATCLTENCVYKYLGPAIRSLQLEEGLEESQIFDGFAKYYGSRISLSPESEKVDRDAVLLQENLQISGYKASNRHVMFNLEETKLILKEMAKFHAMPIAVRLKKPEFFDRYVRPCLKRFDMNAGLSPEDKERMDEDVFQEIAIATNNNSNYVDRFRKLSEYYDDYFTKPDVKDDLYTTTAHSDLWVSNIMLKYDEQGVPNKVKFIDFQLVQYDSAAHDVILFLLTSIETQLLENHLDEFLLLYYKAFIDCLKSVNVSTEQYSFVGFMKEVHNHAPVQIFHAVFLTKIILADNSTMPDDYRDIGMAVINQNVGIKEVSERTADIIRLTEKFRLLYPN
ncbi:uncharacterized protein LOC106084485 [Stomoxys calcitrans]|uniref:uncharacterized protein LOC106084485 n=1 Tax=Stomoxys calcitrans TaxID=35570 RepID=UPI0027E2F216|nr:uncharacterized protein LOC106084485 [Stomoxys calcitrans]